MMNTDKYTYTVNGEEITVWRIDNDVNGNPRYVVHFLSLGLKNYTSIAKETSFKVYRARWFGGGYVFQSYNVQHDLNFAINKIKEMRL